MKSLDDLARLYQDELSAPLAEMEDERKQLMRQYIWLFCVCPGIFLLGAGGMLLLQKPLEFLWIPAIPAILIGGIWYAAIIRQEQKNFVYRFKRKIIKRLVKFIDPGLDYQPTNYIHSSLFMESTIFKQTPDRYRGEDLVKGIVGETDLEFSEIHAEYKTETRNSKGQRQEHWHTIFKGIFFHADFHKHFNGTTVVLPDFAERRFGGFLGGMMQKWNITRGDLIRMEDPEFEKLFVVYGDNQIEARYILTPALMQRLVSFFYQVAKKTNEAMYLAFKRGRIFVAISCRKNLFEPRVFSPNNDPELIFEYWEYMCLVLGIVHELKLNTRIWSKD